jgi:RNA polymerase sigma-70 factor, ECF subfamily
VSVEAPLSVELRARARRDEGQAATVALPELVTRLFRAAYALCGSKPDAEDLVQDTLVRVLSSRRGAKHRHNLPYLMRALRNTWIDGQRSKARRPETPAADAVDWVTDDAADPQLTVDTKAAYAAMRDLSPPLRDVIVAVDVLGLSYKETARSLRIRTGTVMSRLSRARDRVAEALEGAS